jgi:hypothetical protein
MDGVKRAGIALNNVVFPYLETGPMSSIWVYGKGELVKSLLSL